MNVNVAVSKSYSSLRLLDQLSQDFKGAVDLAVKENGLRGPFGIRGFRISEHLLEAFVGTMPVLNLAIFHHVYSLQESGTVGIKTPHVDERVHDCNVCRNNCVAALRGQSNGTQLRSALSGKAGGKLIASIADRECQCAEKQQSSFRPRMPARGRLIGNLGFALQVMAATIKHRDRFR